MLNYNSAWAQGNYPSRPIRVTLGFSAGTSPDVALRLFAEKLSEKWHQPVVVENATGAAGNVAGQRVAHSAADGYNLLFASSSSIVVSPSLYKTMPYNPIKELRPISIFYTHPNVLVVNNGLGVRNIQELIALARSKPGFLNAASAGTGTTQHLAVEMLRVMAGVDIVHVPYRGGMNLLQDLLSGQVSMTFAIPTNIMVQVGTGELTALAVTSAKRFGFMPELPTIAEAGLPEFEMSVWWGLMAPVGTPNDVIQKLHQATVEILAMPSIRRRFDDMNIETRASSPEEFAGIIAAEAPRWADLIARIGIRLD
jgi:tripartite-type tricarboxylate transporter receptor subunit TctC